MSLTLEKRQALTDIWLVGPATLALILFIFLPVAIVAVLSFTDYQFGATSFNWTGLENDSRFPVSSLTGGLLGLGERAHTHIATIELAYRPRPRQSKLQCLARISSAFAPEQLNSPAGSRRLAIQSSHRTRIGYAPDRFMTEGRMPIKIVYWVSTLAFTGFYLFSVFGYITQHEFWADEYIRLGYPAYLIGIMTVVKLLGVLAVWVRKPIWLAQLAYAGFFYHLLLAANAHLQLGEGAALLAVVLLVLVIVSFTTQNGARSGKAAYVPLG